MLKTYSRARSATAAAKKALSNIEAFISRIDATEYEGKFAAEVTIRSGGGKEIVDAVKAAGFIPNLTMRATTDDPVSEILAPEITEAETVTETPIEDIMDIPEWDEDLGDEAEDDDIEDTVSEMLDDMGEDVGEPLTAVAPKGRGGYINEVSSTMGACELARSIAHQMPDAPRKEVIAACRQAGIAYGTARTQIQKVRGGK